MVPGITRRPTRALLVGFLIPGMLAALAAGPPRQAATPSATPTATPTASATPTPTDNPTATPTPTATATSSATGSPVFTASNSPAPPTETDLSTTTPTAGNPATGTSTPTLLPTMTSTPTVLPTPIPSPAPTPVNPLTVLINEVAWSGTIASAQDEWIELHNPGADPISLEGWRLTDNQDISVGLHGTLAPFGFFLLERTDDTTVASLPASMIYTGSLANGGDTLELLGSSGELIDSANSNGGTWPAGTSSPRASMERLGGADQPGNWTTFVGAGFALDRDGNPIAGSPAGTNSAFLASPTPPVTSTAAPSPTPTSGSIAPGSVLINEIAWAGTEASASDEWIELHNPGSSPVTLDGWRLTDSADIDISLAGTIGPYGFFLLERSDDNTVADIAADLIYAGNLRNQGERMELLGPGGERVDSANADGGSWPAGRSDPRASMERRGGDDRSGNWGTFTGFGAVGVDANGQTIGGTPRSPTSILLATPVPTWIPGRLVINEVLIRPHYDREGVGGVSTADEFIELYNHGPQPVWLRGWMLDDVAGCGSRPHPLPGVTISPHSYAVFFRSETHIALNDSGDSVRLLAPNGHMVDKIHYRRVRAYNLSFGRLPDGSNALAYGLWPTPGESNVLFVERDDPDQETVRMDGYACAGDQIPSSLLARGSRQPGRRRWLLSLGLGVCMSPD
ncbi:MAG: lamin tail domain-containing protein [Anaerolineales bacterium]